MFKGVKGMGMSIGEKRQSSGKMVGKMSKQEGKGKGKGKGKANAKLENHGSGMEQGRMVEASGRKEEESYEELEELSSGQGPRSADDEATEGDGGGKDISGRPEAQQGFEAADEVEQAAQAAEQGCEAAEEVEQAAQVAEQGCEAPEEVEQAAQAAEQGCEAPEEVEQAAQAAQQRFEAAEEVKQAAQAPQAAGRTLSYSTIVRSPVRTPRNSPEQTPSLSPIESPRVPPVQSQQKSPTGFASPGRSRLWLESFNSTGRREALDRMQHMIHAVERRLKIEHGVDLQKFLHRFRHLHDRMKKCVDNGTLTATVSLLEESNDILFFVMDECIQLRKDLEDVRNELSGVRTELSGVKTELSGVKTQYSRVLAWMETVDERRLSRDWISMVQRDFATYLDFGSLDKFLEAMGTATDKEGNACQLSVDLNRALTEHGSRRQDWDRCSTIRKDQNAFFHILEKVTAENVQYLYERDVEKIDRVKVFDEGEKNSIKGLMKASVSLKAALAKKEKEKMNGSMAAA